MIRRPLCLDCSVPATWHRYKTAKGTVPLCGFSERISKGSKVQSELSAAGTFSCRSAFRLRFTDGSSSMQRRTPPAKASKLLPRPKIGQKTEKRREESRKKAAAANRRNVDPAPSALFDPGRGHTCFQAHRPFSPTCRVETIRLFYRTPEKRTGDNC